MHRTKRNFVPFILTIAAIVGILMTTAFAEGEAEYVSNFFSTPLSLLPPVLALSLIHILCRRRDVRALLPAGADRPL